MNSLGSEVSSCQSTIERTHRSFSSLIAQLERGPRSGCSAALYIQCAATPYSAVLCMSRVRIWISSGRPSGPITVVCSDWYMLNLGIATKSLKRPGSGFHSECTMPTAP